MRLTILLVLLMGSFASAQVSAGSVGLLWTSANGSTAGSMGCGPSPFSCVIDQTTVIAGEQISIAIRGQPTGTWFLALSLNSIPCTPVPGIVNQLLIAPSGLVVTASGTLVASIGPLACPSGLAQLNFPWPPGLQGIQLYLQAIATGPAAQPAFTNAIQITVL